MYKGGLIASAHLKNLKRNTPAHTGQPMGWEVLDWSEGAPRAYGPANKALAFSQSNDGAPWRTRASLPGLP